MLSLFSNNFLTTSYSLFRRPCIPNLIIRLSVRPSARVCAPVCLPVCLPVLCVRYVCKHDVMLFLRRNTRLTGSSAKALCRTAQESMCFVTALTQCCERRCFRGHVKTNPNGILLHVPYRMLIFGLPGPTFGFMSKPTRKAILTDVPHGMPTSRLTGTTFGFL